MNMENEIKPGDVVRIKSGVLRMTVESIDGDKANCILEVPDPSNANVFAQKSILTIVLVKVQS